VTDAHRERATRDEPVPDAGAPEDAAQDEVRYDDLVDDVLGGDALMGDEPSGDEPTADDAPEAAADGVTAHDLAREEDPRTREELLSELVEAESRRDEYLEDVRRARAEFENYRKRIMREGAAQRDAGRAEVVVALLEALDDLDRTREAAVASQDDALAKGVELVADKIARSLGSLGLERLDATGVPFDPGCHEAVQHRPAAAAGDDGEAGADVPAEDDGPRVAEVLRPGYRLGERVLRPAMVVVEE
jgi:molecular chaperone GrpE